MKENNSFKIHGDVQEYLKYKEPFILIKNNMFLVFLK